ncbi:MAG: hypothetical protein HC834_01865 [Rhodospirillales bacterium]|nr:hypothetical protein [Rhodospirillales bacterium]
MLANWQTNMRLIQATIDGRVLVTDARPSNSIARLAAAFTSLKASAAALHPTLRDVSSETHLGYALALPILRFEIWTRGLSVQSRRLQREAGQAAEEFMRRVEPGVRAFYAPRKGESLLGISTQFYRTPNHWPAIARRNNLVGISLAGNEFLIIPEVR